MPSRSEVLAFRQSTDCLDWRMKQNSRPNVIRVNANESMAHFMEKCRQCHILVQQGKTFYTEAIFRDGKGRADIFVVDDFLAIEIVHTEDILVSGKQKYPCPVRFIDAEKGTQIDV